MTSLHRSHLKTIVIVVASALTCITTQAQTRAPTTSGPLTWRAGLIYQHDDNFFRVPAGSAVREQILTETVGVKLSVPYSLQQFEIEASVNNNQYQEHKSFDYLGKNLSAAWRWSLTPQLRGNLTGSHVDRLNAATDNLNPTIRNKNTATNYGFDAVYDWGSPWQLVAGVARSTSVNEHPVVGVADEKANHSHIGFRHNFTTGNSFGYTLRHERGTNPNNFTGLKHEINGIWVASGNTTVDGNMAYQKRDFTTTPLFNYDGFSGGINVRWQATGKVNIVASWARDLSSYQTLGSSYTKTNTFSVAPVWTISPKTSINLMYRYALRDELGSPTGIPSGRTDTLQDALIAFNWQPQPYVTLLASLAHSQRSSNFPGLAFRANVATLSAQFSF